MNASANGSRAGEIAEREDSFLLQGLGGSIRSCPRCLPDLPESPGLCPAQVSAPPGQLAARSLAPAITQRVWAYPWGLTQDREVHVP